MGDESSIKWAVDLLAGPSHSRGSFVYRNRGEIGLEAAILTTPMLLNKVRCVPWYTGLPQSIYYWMLPATACMLIITTSIARSHAKKDARLLDYVRTYPERFPEPPNKQYKDLFQPWVPFR